MVKKNDLGAEASKPLFFYVVNIENTLISTIQQNHVDDSLLHEAADSLNSIMLELDDELLNIKHLMLTLAKRSISDFYYLVSTYWKFFMKKNFQYENDIKAVLNEFIRIINQQHVVNNNVDMLIKYNSRISSLFQDSSNAVGWRMNESSVKEYLEKDNPFVLVTELTAIAREAFAYKNNLKNYYLFLKYYYNESDGKLFRLNFVSESLKIKLNDGKIKEDVYTSFEEIRQSFTDYRNLFEETGISGFGHDKMSYYELLNFIYKLCKIIEFYYLRNMKYTALQDLRSEIFYYVENEILSIRS